MKDNYRTVEGRKILEGRYMEILEDWPVPNIQQLVETSFGPTFVIKSGEPIDSPLILLHGSVSNSLTWYSDVAELSKKYYVIAVDIMGEPGLSTQERPKYSSDAFQNWLREILENLNIQSCFIAGVSFGGWAALNFGIHYPKMVRGLFLTCPAGLTKANTFLLYKILFYSIIGKNNKVTSILNGGKLPKENSALKAVMELTGLIFKYFKPRRDSPPIFSDQQLAQLTMPVCLVFGEKDYLFSPTGAAANLNKSVPHSEISFLPDTGHVIVGQTLKMIEFFDRTNKH